MNRNGSGSGSGEADIIGGGLEGAVEDIRRSLKEIKRESIVTQKKALQVRH
jgi:hypothetical protein